MLLNMYPLNFIVNSFYSSPALFGVWCRTENSNNIFGPICIAVHLAIGRHNITAIEQQLVRNRCTEVIGCKATTTAIEKHGLRDPRKGVEGESKCREVGM